MSFKRQMADQSPPHMLDNSGIGRYAAGTTRRSLVPKNGSVQKMALQFKNQRINKEAAREVANRYKARKQNQVIQLDKYNDQTRRSMRGSARGSIAIEDGSVVDVVGIKSSVQYQLTM